MRSTSFLLAGCLTACAAGSKPASSPAAAEAGAVRLDVPLFADRTDQCGPAALAGVLGFWGKAVDMGALKKEIYRPSLKGSISIDLLLSAQAHGMSARLLDGGLAQIKKELDAGHPLVAFLNQGLRFLPVGHYVVLTGYDARRRGLYINSDVRKNAFMSDASFERQWKKADRWALLIQPSPD